MKKKFRNPQAKIVYPKNKQAKLRTPRRMNRREKIQLFGLAFLFAMAGALGIEFSLMKRVVHEHAQIESLDMSAMTMKLKMEDQVDPVMIQWKKDTEFMIETKEVTPAELKPLMDVIVWKKDSLFFSNNILKITASQLVDPACSNSDSNKANCTVR